MVSGRDLGAEKNEMDGSKHVPKEVGSKCESPNAQLIPSALQHSIALRDSALGLLDG